MSYRSSMIRTLAAIAAFSFYCASPASAQNGGTGTNLPDTTGGTATDTGQPSLGGVDADEAFSNVDRNATVGSTSQTGLGFSDLSAGVGGANGIGGLGGGGFGGGGFGGALGGQFGGQGFGGQTQNAQPVIRTRLRSAIEGTSFRTPQAVQQKISYQMQTVPRRAGLGGVNVTLDGSTAIATGIVSTEKRRRMTELLLRLEPGVRRVDNRITVAP